MENKVKPEAKIDHVVNPSSTAPLLNPVILERIFSFLDADTLLKSVRLVCSVWADIGAPFLGRKCGVVCKTWLPCRLYHFNPQLARKTRIFTGCSCATRADECTCLVPYFVFFLPKICHLVETLQLKVAISTTRHWPEMWMGLYTFPNMTHLEIEANCRNDAFTEREVPNFAILPKLKTLYFKGDRCRGNVGPIFQRLINSAPNLERLKYKGNFYPHLELCRKLNAFEYEYDNKYSPGKLDFVKVLRTLKGCRDSVEQVTLMCFLDERTARADRFRRVERHIGIDFPFPKLTHFMMDTDIYKIQDSLDNLHFPKLTHLSIDHLSISEFFTTFHKRHDRVKSIELKSLKAENFVDSKQADRVKNLFPALQEFTLKLQTPPGYRLTEESFHWFYLSATLALFSDWKLARMKVFIGHGIEECFNYRTIMREKTFIISDVLKGIANWKVLQNMWIEFNGPIDLSTEKVRDALLSCGPLGRVVLKGIQCDDPTFSWLKSKDNVFIVIRPDTIYINQDDVGLWKTS